MKIEYKTIIQKGGYNKYEALKIDWCCNEFKNHSSFSFVPDYNQSPNMYVHYVQGGYYGGLDTEYEPIEFCPFCGEKINCCEALKVEQKRKVKMKKEVREVVTYEEVPIDG